MGDGGPLRGGVDARGVSGTETSEGSSATMKPPTERRQRRKLLTLGGVELTPVLIASGPGRHHYGTQAPMRFDTRTVVAVLGEEAQPGE